jgi:hypothetical protein
MKLANSTFLWQVINMKNKLNLDEDTMALIDWHAKESGLSASDIIDRLLSAHLSELWELRTFMEANLAGAGLRDAAKNLLISFGGGESIVSGIKRIAPEYQTLGDRFMAALDAPYPTAPAPL